MSGFSKLWSDIILSSVWSEDDKTRIVWVTLLALSNADGHVSCSLPGLANAARVSLDECAAALQKLASPDPHSRTKDHEGRRIEAVDGGWLILNYRAYRDRTSDDPNAVKTRERVRRYREKQALSPSPSPRNDTEAEAESRSRSSVALRNVTEDGFEEFWSAYPKKKGKAEALEAFRSVVEKHGAGVVALIQEALRYQCESEEWLRDGGQYVPRATKYLQDDGSSVTSISSTQTRHL
jgi:hypothetical protein